jgi:soluble lytic murein transglycosylase-like protein
MATAAEMTRMSFGITKRRFPWVAVLALAGLSLAFRGRADGQPATRPSSAVGKAEIPLPPGDPWESALVEPPLESPVSAGPWEAAAVEPDGMPLPVSPAATLPLLQEKARGDAAASPTSAALVPPEREYLRKTLVRYAQENGLPADLVMALAWKESSWRVRVTSEAGAIGVMQLMPKTVEFTSRHLMGLTHDLNPRNAVANIRMGTRFLRHLVDQSEGDYRRALIAYNQGITALRARGAYPESEDFADTVLALRLQFRRP